MAALVLAGLFLAGPPAAPDPTAHRGHALLTRGDPKRGEALFFSDRAKCSACHAVGGKGGAVGPDLSAVGGKFDRPHLIESVTEPSRQIVEGYRATVLTLADGRTLTGIVKGESGGRLKLVDAEGKAHELAAAEIEARREAKTSLMPEGLWAGLSKDEFADLVAYLEARQAGGPLTLPAGFTAETVAAGFTGATALCVAPDGRVFACEQTGALRVVKNDRLLPEPFVKLPVDSTWERGLLGVAVAPDFPQAPHVYVVYVAAKPYPHHVVSRFTAAGDVAEPGSERVLFEGDDQTKLGGKVPAGHQGGAVHFGADGNLYVALGEGTAEAPAQRLDSLLGKVLRLNPDGTIPADNPFVNQTTGKYRAVWALGLRNPYTLAVRPKTGRLWANDVGGVCEEVNELVAGGNYGWPTADHGPTTDPRFRGPVYSYFGVSVCGGAFAPPDLAWPAVYRGRYFFMDFAHGWVRTLDPDKPATAEGFATGFRRPVDLRFSPDGSLYVLVRDAWVIDREFKPGTGSLVKVRYTGTK